jgi:hypothetical protein
MDNAGRGKRLEELERQIWPHNDFGSHVVQESQRLRKVPIGALSIEDLRLLIGQKMGLEFLVPLVLERLAANPLVSGDYYEGDLLSMVLAIPDTFWAAHPALNNQMVEIGLHLASLSETVNEEFLPSLRRFQRM